VPLLLGTGFKSQIPTWIDLIQGNQIENYFITVGTLDWTPQVHDSFNCQVYTTMDNRMAHRQGTSTKAVPLLCPAQFGAPDSAPDYACLTETNPHPVLICRAGNKLSYGNAAAERLTLTLGFETPAALLPADHLDIKHRCLAGHRPVRAAASAAGRRIIWSYHPAGTDTVHLYGVDLSDNPLNTVLEHLNFGVLLVDSELRVHYANPATRALLNDDSPLRIEPVAGDDMLRSDPPIFLAKVLRMVTDFCKTAQNTSTQSVLVVPRVDGAGTLEIIAAPAVAESLAPQLATSLVTLFVIAPAQGSGLCESSLCSLYGLTPAECKIATLLADGHHSDEITATLGIHISTLRSHLRHLFRKTHTTGQPQLVRLLTSGVARMVSRR